MSWEWVSLSIWLDWSQWESPYVQLNECPYQSDLSEPNGNLPMVEWKCPYQSDLMWVKMSVPIKMNGIDEIWTRISEMKWIEVKWRIWRIWLCEPYEKVPMVERECPYQNDLICLLWPNPFKMIRIDEKWVNWVKWSEMMDLMDLTWNNPMRKSLWSVEGEPYRSDLMWVKMNVPIKMNGIDEKWMNWSE